MKTFLRSISVGGAQQRGFSIVTAIFLLVVLAGLGAGMVALSTMSNSTTTLDLQGARAYQAARAGVEWGMYRHLRQNVACPFTSSFALPAGALQGFSVTVSCTRAATPGVAAPAVTTSAVTNLVAGNTNATLVAPATTTALVDGMRLAGNGVASRTYISARLDDTTIVLNRPAAATGAFTLTYYAPLDQWTVTATACNQPASGVCPNQNNSPDYVQRTVQVQF